MNTGSCYAIAVVPCYQAYLLRVDYRQKEKGSDRNQLIQSTLLNPLSLFYNHLQEPIRMVFLHCKHLSFSCWRETTRLFCREYRPAISFWHCCSKSSKLHYQAPSMLDFLDTPKVLSEKTNKKSVSSASLRKMFVN